MSGQVNDETRCGGLTEVDDSIGTLSDLSVLLVVLVNGGILLLSMTPDEAHGGGWRWS